MILMPEYCSLTTFSLLVPEVRRSEQLSAVYELVTPGAFGIPIREVMYDVEAFSREDALRRNRELLVKSILFVV